MRLDILRLREALHHHGGWIAFLLLILLVAPIAFIYLFRDTPPPEPELPLPQEAELGRFGMSDAAAEAYRAAAAAFQHGDEAAAREHLEELAEIEPDQAALARTLIGLYAYERQSWEVAVEALARPAAAGGALEDWRLLALADSARRLDRPEVAVEALSRLLAEERDSPLAGRAYVEVATLAWEERQAERALAWIREARDRQLSRGMAIRADELAWRIGRETGDREVEAEAAKRLLVHAPATARKLQVHEIFAGPDGSIDSWDGILTSEQVLERARSWLELDQGRSAMFTLETVPAADQDLEWRLLMAEAYTLQHRGRDARALLAQARPADDTQRAALEWQRARATAEMATARRGRSNPPVAERRRLMVRAQRHLENVVAVGADSELTVSALRQLYGYLAEEGLFDEAVEKLRQLRRLDPEDRTGTGPLWERGWRHYLRGNYTGAVGYWTELEELYPRDRETRRARYWKARALGELGDGARARAAFRAVLEESDAADFYFGRAAARVPEAPPVPTATAESRDQSWEIDPLLARPLRLAELGLVGLAGEEMQLVAGDGAVRERDRLAMDGILRVKGGAPREGVGMLRGAFPSLASPYQSAAPGPVLSAYYPFLYGEEIEKHARRTRLPPHLVAGIIRQESAFDVRAESWAGARGLMQLMPATAKEVAGKLGRVHRPNELFDPEYSILLGSTYFRYVLDRFDGNVELALAGYNGGPNRIRRLWREAGRGRELDYFLETLPIPESQDYVKRILVLADSYRQLYWDEDQEIVASTEDVRL
ncbi:MAG TPA: transglycosylase SLT domain-containing protein [Thermoanaerobaculia bacterium]